METINSMKMKVEALSINESFIRSAVGAFCVQLNPTIEEIGDIKTAVSEGVTNCIVHAYNYSKGEINIEVKLHKQSVTIVIEDFGKGIDNLEKAMQPFYTTCPEDERSGMGFTVMDAFMDKLEVFSKKNEGTKIVMEKYIRGGTSVD